MFNQQHDSEDLASYLKHILKSPPPHSVSAVCYKLVILLLYVSSYCSRYVWGLRLVMILRYIYGPGHEISSNVVYATSTDSDQLAHTHSLIRTFASRLSIL